MAEEITEIKKGDAEEIVNTLIGKVVASITLEGPSLVLTFTDQTILYCAAVSITGGPVGLHVCVADKIPEGANFVPGTGRTQ